MDLRHHFQNYLFLLQKDSGRRQNLCCMKVSQSRFLLVLHRQENPGGINLQIFFLLLHQFFVTVVHLIAHSFHNFLHTSVTSSDFFKSFLLLSLGCLHLFTDSLCFFLFELCVGNGSLLPVFFIIFNDFESSSLINLLLRRQLLLIHCEVLL